MCVGLHDVMGDIHDSITTPTNVFRDFVGYIAEKVMEYVPCITICQRVKKKEKVDCMYI